MFLIIKNTVLQFKNTVFYYTELLVIYAPVIIPIRIAGRKEDTRNGKNVFFFNQNKEKALNTKALLEVVDS